MDSRQLVVYACVYLWVIVCKRHLRVKTAGKMSRWSACGGPALRRHHAFIVVILACVLRFALDAVSGACASITTGAAEQTAENYAVLLVVHVQVAAYYIDAAAADVLEAGKS